MADEDLVNGYLDALRAARAATTPSDRERAEGRGASYWLVMDGATQTAAILAAAKAGLLKPGTDRHVLKLYPVVRGEKVVWVTIPERKSD